MKLTYRREAVALETEEARTQEAGFFKLVFPKERRYAELGSLLPFPNVEPAV